MEPFVLLIVTYQPVIGSDTARVGFGLKGCNSKRAYYTVLWVFQDCLIVVFGLFNINMQPSRVS